jgi:hypothetical protein
VATGYEIKEKIKKNDVIHDEHCGAGEVGGV